MVFLSWFSRAMIFRRAQEENFQSLPDDVVINILCRLPAKSILQCRRVCKTWRNLTSTSYFTELLFKAAKPSVLVLFNPPATQKFCVVNREIERQYICLGTDEAIGAGELTVTPISRYLTQLINKKQHSYPKIVSSCHGLILYTAFDDSSDSIGDWRYFICNPITQENITLPCPENLVIRPCGFFFHPLTQEHRVLFVCVEGCHHVYKIFSLETNSWRNLSCISLDPPMYFQNPTTVNGSLHWRIKETRQASDLCENSILRFDLNTEILDTVPHPEYENCTKNHRTYLAEVGGELCFLQFLNTQSYMRINTWILVDSTNKRWGKRYQLNLDHLVKYPSVLRRERIRDSFITIFGIYNDEFLLLWEDKGLFSHNLRQGTTRKFETKGKYGKCDKIGHFSYVKSVIVYYPSLVSLKLCSEVLKGKQVAVSGKG